MEDGSVSTRRFTKQTCLCLREYVVRVFDLILTQLYFFSWSHLPTAPLPLLGGAEPRVPAEFLRDRYYYTVLCTVPIQGTSGTVDCRIL